MVNSMFLPITALVMAGLVSGAPVQADEECETCTKIESGLVQGAKEGQVITFKGIPYASPPTGDLRFQPPNPPKAWEGKLTADRYQAVCPQSKDPMEEYPEAAKKVKTSNGEEMEVYDNEDCLYLNVWTPKIDTKKRPVMVFLHGGAFVVGTASSDFYTGKNLATNDVVVVTLNYRLGLFGYMEMGDLDKDLAGNGNNGLKDQLAALAWVKQNASAFGGDPQNITVFGESAGSASVNALLATKHPETLFRRAIAQSGGAQIIHTPKMAKQASDDIFKASGAANFTEFKKSSTLQLLQAQQSAYETSKIGDLLFAPFIDGTLILGDPNSVIKQGNAKSIDLMAGATQNEMNYWSLYDSQQRNMFTDTTDLGPASPLMSEKFRKRVEDSIGSTLDAKYSAILNEADKSKIRQAQNDDFAMIQPMRKLAEIQQPNNSNIYLYRFQWAVPDKYIPSGQKNLGSFHAMELPFVFGTLDLSWVPGGDKFIEENNREARRLSHQMMTAWTNFAKTGNPNGSGVPAWPKFDTSTRKTMLWRDTPVATTDPDKQRREIWKNEDFSAADRD